MGGADLLGEALDDGGYERGEAAGLVVNAGYAEAFEKHKRKKELLRLAERAAEADDDSSSDDESEDEGAMDPSADAEFSAALLRIKNRDPKLFSKGSKEELFTPPQPKAADAAKGKKEKPVYLKDYQAKRLLEEGAEAAVAEDDAGDAGAGPTYVEEQGNVKGAFLRAAGGFGGGAAGGSDSDDDDDMFTLNKAAERPEAQGGDGGAGFGAFGGGGGMGFDNAVLGSGKDSAAQADALLASYFGKVEELNAQERFLKDYLSNKGWVEQEEAGGAASRPRLADLAGDDSEDERELEQADAFEAAYNFRFEEPGGANIVSHARAQDATVRKDPKKERRKAARERKAEKKSKARRDAVEELKRLKALKRKEIESRLKEIAQTAGLDPRPDGGAEGAEEGAAAAGAIGADDLDDEFDPEEHDRKMAAIFSDEYYDAKDAGFKPAGKGGAAAGPMSQAELDDIEIPDYGEEDEDYGDGGGGEDVEMAGAAAEAYERGEKEMDAMHFEDVIGDTKTRFRYRQVQPDYGGLTPEEILWLDDKELNQIVSLKRLAPYKHEKLKPNKQALRDARRAAKGHRQATAEGSAEPGA
eukprot:PRCOL_00003643-RA